MVEKNFSNGPGAAGGRGWSEPIGANLLIHGSGGGSEVQDNWDARASITWESD